MVDGQNNNRSPSAPIMTNEEGRIISCTCVFPSTRYRLEYVCFAKRLRVVRCKQLHHGCKDENGAIIGKTRHFDEPLRMGLFTNNNG